MKLLVLICMLLSGVSVFSQSWENLTNKDWVFSIDEEDEFLWIGTSGGLVKLNKQTKETITFDRANTRIPDNNVLSLGVENNNTLWLGSRFSGIGSFINEECVTYNSENSNIPHDQYNSCIVIDSENNKYVGSLGYVSIFKNGGFEIIKEMDLLVPFDCINDIKTDNSNNVWIASYNGLYNYDGNITEKITEVSGDISSVALDNNDGLWVGSDNGLYYFNGTKWVCYNTENSGLPSNSVRKICFDSSNNLWISTYANLVCFSSSGIWTTYNCETQTIDNFYIFTLIIDTDDNIWIGTRNNGLMVFENGVFEKVNYSKPSMFPSNAINYIAYDNEKVWISIGDKGLYNFDGQYYNSWDTLNSNLSYQEVLLISPDNEGNIWLTTKKTTYTTEGYTPYFKLTKFDGAQFFDIETPMSVGQCRVFKVDVNGVFWFGTQVGLYKWDGTNWEHYNRDNSPLSSNIINEIDFDSKGNIWIGQNGMWDDEGHLIGGGLIKYDGNNNWQEYNIWNSSLPYNTIKALKVDKSDIVWLGTVNDGAYDGGGLTRFDGENWQSFTKDNSECSDNQVLDIDEDAEGVIWSGTMFGGLVGYDKSDKWTIFMQSNSGDGFYNVPVGKTMSFRIGNSDKMK
ncbi:MAG: hypothetical protein HQ521_08770, partial [Bacteroidetes bacterium]|nr:hypothetical protein [Bacteroidota bacterium]